MLALKAHYVWGHFIWISLAFRLCNFFAWLEAYDSTQGRARRLLYRQGDRGKRRRDFSLSCGKDTKSGCSLQAGIMYKLHPILLLTRDEAFDSRKGYRQLSSYGVPARCTISAQREKNLGPLLHQSSSPARKSKGVRIITASGPSWMYILRFRR